MATKPKPETANVPAADVAKPDVALETKQFEKPRTAIVHLRKYLAEVLNSVLIENRDAIKAELEKEVLPGVLMSLKNRIDVIEKIIGFCSSRLKTALDYEKEKKAEYDKKREEGDTTTVFNPASVKIILNRYHMGVTLDCVKNSIEEGVAVLNQLRAENASKYRLQGITEHQKMKEILLHELTKASDEVFSKDERESID